MTSTEINLLAEVLKIHTEMAVTKAIEPLKEELKKIKALNAQILKEGRQAPQQEYSQTAPRLTLLGKPQNYGEDIITEGRRPAADAPSIYDDPSLKMASMHAKASEGLPDVDLPIPNIFKR
jgi:hypothetical protein